MPNDQQDWTSVIARPQTQLAGSPWAYATLGAVQVFTLAPNTSIVGILLPGFATVAELKVTGVTTGTVYLDVNPANAPFQQFYYVPVMEAADAQVSVSIFATSAASAYVASIPDPVGVLSLPANPPPWQAPNQVPTPITFTNPGIGNSRALLPTPGVGRTLYLHTAMWEYSGIAAGQTGAFRDGAGATYLVDDATAFGGPRFMDFAGARIATGQQLLYVQTGTAAVGSYTVSGSFTYSVL